MLMTRGRIGGNIEEAPEGRPQKHFRFSDFPGISARGPNYPFGMRKREYVLKFS
jgi:hypothetical protein